MICVDHGENTISKEMFRDKRIKAELGGIHFKVLDAIMKNEYPDKFATRTSSTPQEEKKQESQ